MTLYEKLWKKVAKWMKSCMTNEKLRIKVTPWMKYQGKMLQNG